MDYLFGFSKFDVFFGICSFKAKLSKTNACQIIAVSQMYLSQKMTETENHRTMQF